MAVHRETWTDEKVETLQRMHTAGEPFSRIGVAIGMTRNATIGKARRLGLLRIRKPSGLKNAASGRVVVAWTPAMDDTLRDLHVANFVFDDIAAKLSARHGVQVSKNSCISRAARIGLPERRQQLNRVAKPVAPRISRTERAKDQMHTRGIRPAGGLPKDPDERREVFCAIADKANDRFNETSAAVVGADNPGVLFLERGLFQCAMPMAGWDDAPVQEKRVCGRPVKANPREGLMTSYCPACSRLVYAPAGFREFKERSMGEAA